LAQDVDPWSYLAGAFDMAGRVTVRQDNRGKGDDRPRNRLVVTLHVGSSEELGHGLQHEYGGTVTKSGKSGEYVWTVRGEAAYTFLTGIWRYLTVNYHRAMAGRLFWLHSRWSQVAVISDHCRKARDAAAFYLQGGKASNVLDTELEALERGEYD
jgi:hypothetical protein